MSYDSKKRMNYFFEGIVHVVQLLGVREFIHKLLFPKVFLN